MPTMRNYIAAALVICFTGDFGSVTAVHASEWIDNEKEIVGKLGKWAGDFAKKSDQISPFTKALAEVVGKARGLVETVTNKSLIDPAKFEQLDADRQEMDATMPPALPSLNAPGAYKAMVGDVETPATYESGQEELGTLDKVGAERAETISKMKVNRDTLQETATRYQANADTAAKVGDGLDKIIEENPMIDVAFSFTGVNGYFSITALAWDAEIEPAFNERATAAQNAVKRFDTAIQAGELDLKTFNSLKSEFRHMYSLDPTAIDTQGLNPSSVDMNPGAVGKLLEEARAATAHAQEVADTLQKEAADIAKHNGEISRIQMFLGMMRSVGTVADATTDESAAANTTTTTTTTTINNDNRKFYFKVVPGAFLQQDRRGQTPIDKGATP